MKKASERKNFSSLDIITAIALSISLGFTVFFFSPIDVFLGNQKDFVVGASAVIIPMLIMAAVSSALLFVIARLMMRKKALFSGVMNILFGILISFYVQMLFFNGSMNRIGTTEGYYGDLNFKNIFNFILMYALIFLPLILSDIRNKKSEENSAFNFAKGKIVPYVSSLIFIMQLCGTVNLMISNGFLKTDKSHYEYYLSYEPVTSLSKEENIVVFLADRLDSRWMDETLEAYPELKAELEGFTYYQNNISAYNRTFPSIPSMLSNVEYNGEEWEDYLNKVWSGSTLPDELNKNGYKVNLLIDSLTTYSDYSQLASFNNIKDTTGKYQVNYFGENGVIPVMTNLSLFKLSPYLVKGFFGKYNGDLSNNFLILSEELPGRMKGAVGIQSDTDISRYFNSNKLTDDCDQKTFSFIHLNASHEISAYTSKLAPSFGESDEPTLQTTIRGTYEIMLTYIRQMKELGVYDNSTIIIISDHGPEPDVNMAALLIKPKNSGHNELQINSTAELSNVNFYASVLEYAGIDHSAQGYSYNDIINGELHPDRYHQTFIFHADSTVDYDHYYKVTGNAYDPDNWEILE